MSEQASSFLMDFLTKQVPVICVLGLGFWLVASYLKTEIQRLNALLKLKDEEIKILNDKVLVMAEKVVTVSERVYTAFENNTQAIQDLKAEIRKK